MTTNFLNRLDSALIRPGRVDFAQLIDNASKYQVRKPSPLNSTTSEVNFLYSGLYSCRSKTSSVGFILKQVKKRAKSFTPTLWSVVFVVFASKIIIQLLNYCNSFLSLLPTIQSARPSISMALLQGHLLLYKHDPEGAIASAAQIGRMAHHPGSHSTQSSGKTGDGVEAPVPKKAAPVVSKRRVLTVEEVDKMYFNPQAGWDKDIKSL